MFIHTVYFWTKPNTPPAAIDQLNKDCHELLSKIPTVKTIFAGRPTVSTRPVIDDSYAIGLTVIFTDSPGHDVYQTHPLHLEFIARNKAHWEKVQVYDFID